MGKEQLTAKLEDGIQNFGYFSAEKRISGKEQTRP
jgi:hypothetical protein